MTTQPLSSSDLTALAERTREATPPRGFAAIGLVGPKIEHNVGGAMRAAACYGASLIVIEAPRFEHRSSNTTQTQKHVPTIVGPICDHRPYDCPMVAIEIVPDARPLTTFCHPERALYVFGPEDGSIPPRILTRAQHIVSIPTRYCMNLAATVNVVLYDRLCKREARRAVA